MVEECHPIRKSKESHHIMGWEVTKSERPHFLKTCCGPAVFSEPLPPPLAGQRLAFCTPHSAALATRLAAARGQSWCLEEVAASWPFSQNGTVTLKQQLL